MKQGEPLGFRLPGNPTTGFTWNNATKSDALGGDLFLGGFFAGVAADFFGIRLSGLGGFVRGGKGGGGLRRD